MIITCDECSSSFNVNDSLVKEAGSKVRCSKCDSVFVAYPQPTEDIEVLEMAEDDLALDADDQLLAEDEDLGLDVLDSDFTDFIDDDEEDETLAMSSDTEESGLELSDFDDTSEAASGLVADDVSEEDVGELELDLDFDQDDESELALDEESIAGDDLPDLGDFEDLTDLDEEKLALDEADPELEDLDLELESENDAELELESNDGLDLTDLGLEEASAEDGEALEVVETDELDLSDLELSIDDDTVPGDTAETVSEELTLDIDDDEQGVEEIAEAELNAEAANELDLADLDLDLEDSAIAAEASAAGSEDLELDLDLDLEADTAADSEQSATDELDLSDLTDIMEGDESPAAITQPEELDLELDLESDASTGADAPATVADSGDNDELDLSDLEDFMESEGAPSVQASADDSAQDLEMDLDFQIDGDAQTTEAATASQANDELDFSDLEQMLESDETPSVEATERNEDEELDLQFDLDKPSTAGADAAAAQDDDFLDIEQLLEGGEDSGPSENVELDGNVTALPLEMEAALDDASKGAEAELELDFDLESELQDKEDLLDNNESTDHQLESNLLTSDEVDFLDEAGIEEMEFQDESETSVLNSDDFASDELIEADDAYGETQVLPGSENDLAVAEAESMAPVATKPKRARSKKPLLVVVLLLLLAVGVTVVPNMLGFKIPYISDIKIPYLSDLDLKIPYLSDWLNPQPQDIAGNLKIIPLGNTIDGKFVDNSKTGQLFVIKGKIKNDYDHPRSYIKVTGKLYLKGKKIAKKATVYCGNMLTNKDLAAMDIAAINKKLHSRTGDKKSNFKVKTGNMVPFMIVFDKLPRNLDEYTVEVEGSSI